MNRFVYHEWDILYEEKKTPSKCERLIRREGPHLHSNLFGIKLQETRIRLRLTIEDVANKMHIDPKTVTMFENGSEMPSSETKAQLEKILKLEE